MRIARRRAIARRAAALVVLLLWEQMAFAHAPKGEAAGFLTGFRHPISGLDHVLAMIAVGLWGAQLDLLAIWLLPVAFPLVMALGGMLGLMGGTASWRRVWDRCLGVAAWRCCYIRSARPPWLSGSPGRIFRHLPRVRPRD